jgi:hypothetical protein
MSSVVGLHPCNVIPAQGKDLDAVPAPAPASAKAKKLYN